MSFTTTRQLRRQAPIAAILLLLLLAFSAVGASAATTVAPYAGSVTAPSGGVWLPGPAGSPGHLWISDSVLGFCRVDVAGLTACNTTAKTPGQPSFDATTGSVYVPDWSATSLGVYRLHFNQATETIDSATLLRPTDGLGGNHPTATALDPVSGALYVGFARTPNIVRISNPSLGVGDPKVVMGNSTDNKQTFSLAFLNVAGSVRLIEADSLGLGQVINPAACASRCLASPLGLGIAAPLSVVADTSGTALFIGDATSVARFDALAAISAGNPSTYASGFANVSGLAVDPAGVVYAADDATRGLTPGLGHIWSINQVVVTAPAAPTAVSATAGDAQATVSWTAPASDSGSPITSYTVTSSPAGGSAVVTAPATSATVTGLTNGTAYTFTVVATNAVGSSADSVASNSVSPVAPVIVPPVVTPVPPVVTPVPPVVTPVPPVVTPVPPVVTPVPVVTAPDAPSAVAATAGDAQATVSWTAPALDGGSPITSYTVTSSPAGGSAVVTAPATSATITGLTNGTAYTFTVVATNAVGSSAASLASNSVTPITVPGAPTIGTATAGNANATISWTAPLADGGSAITGYTVTSTPGGLSTTVAAPATSATVSGLTNGTAYTFTVTAANAAGSSAASLASNSVTPITVPGAPTAVAATAGAGSARVSWTAPASDGGSAIRSYTVVSAPGGLTATVTGPATSASVTGLTNGTAYTFTVTATNAAGSSAASAPSNIVTPFTVPSAPGIGSATAGSSQATVTWTAPVANGGSPITGYTVTSAPGGLSATAASTATSATVTGLTPGTAYTFTVTAANAAGSSAASLASNSVTPFTVPGAPTAATATTSSGQATVTWTAPVSDGFSPIAGYTVTSIPGGLIATVAAPATSATISGLTNGTAYTFTVTAANAAGSSPASLASNSVTPSGPPSPVITQNPPNPTGNPNVTFAFTSNTPGATFACSLAAAASADAFSACTSPHGYGPLADGTYSFKLTATDPTTGQTSSPAVYTFVVSTATAPTTTAPVAQPAVGAHATIGGLPVTISWSGTACTTGAAGCNVASYHVQKSINGLAFFDVALSSPTASSIVESLTPSPVNQATVTTYTYRVQATSTQGQVSPFAIGPTFSVATTDDSGAVSYSGTWASAALVGAFGGAAHSSSLAGSTASLSTGFSGTGIGLVSSLGPDRGIAEITLDGAVVGTVDLYSPTLQAGQVVWSTASLPSGAHTIKVTVLGTHNPASSGTRVDVDAFAAIK